MRLLHVGDAHLGCRPYGVIQRELDIYQALLGIGAAAVANAVDAVLLPGDIFDSNRPPGAAVMALREFNDMLSAAGIPVFGFAGNHDIDNACWLDLAGVKQAPEDGVITVKGIRMLLVPYSTAARLPELVEQALIAAGEPIEVVSFHATIADLAGFPGDYPTAAVLSAVMKPFGVQYVAMGDVHKRGVVEHDEITFVYPGSTEALKSDEIEVKAVAMVDLTPGEPSALKLEWLPIATRAILTGQVDTMGQVDDLVSKADKLDQPMLLVQVARTWDGGVREVKSILAGHGLLCRVSLAPKVPTTVVEGEVVDMPVLDGIVRWDAEKARRAARESVHVLMGEHSPEAVELVLGVLDDPQSMPDRVRTFLEERQLSTYTEVLSG